MWHGTPWWKATSQIARCKLFMAYPKYFNSTLVGHHWFKANLNLKWAVNKWRPLKTLIFRLPYFHEIFTLNWVFCICERKSSRVYFAINKNPQAFWETVTFDCLEIEMPSASRFKNFDIFWINFKSRLIPLTETSNFQFPKSQHKLKHLSYVVHPKKLLIWTTKDDKRWINFIFKRETKKGYKNISFNKRLPYILKYPTSVKIPPWDE